MPIFNDVIAFFFLISVIAQECGQTLGLGLGQSKDIVVVIISLQWTKS